MSCLYEMSGHFCSLHKVACTYPCEDFLTEEQVLANNTYCYSYKIDETERKPYCKYCFNARVYKPTDEELMDPFSTELTDENDFSSCGVGTSYNNTRLMITSGHGEPVRIEIDKFFEDYQEWHTVGKYYPKYCPECGRRLNEYEESNTHD